MESNMVTDETQKWKDICFFDWADTHTIMRLKKKRKISMYSSCNLVLLPLLKLDSPVIPCMSTELQENGATIDAVQEYKTVILWNSDGILMESLVLRWKLNTRGKVLANSSVLSAQK